MTSAVVTRPGLPRVRSATRKTMGLRRGDAVARRSEATHRRVPRSAAFRSTFDRTRERCSREILIAHPRAFQNLISHIRCMKCAESNQLPHEHQRAMRQFSAPKFRP